MNTETISIVIPSYNHNNYVLRAIESVLHQEYNNIDLIVIDDGSTDGSKDIIAEYHRKYSEFRFISRENQGIIRTLNEGIALANGELFCLLASDDYLTPHSLQSRAEYLQTHSNYAAVFGDAVIIDAEDRPTGHIMNEERRQLFSMPDPVQELINGCRLPIHTMMTRLSVLRKLGAFDVRYSNCEDLDVQLLLFLQGSVGLIDDQVYCYRRHDANVSGLNRNIARADKVLCYRKYLEEIPELQPYHRLIRFHLRKLYLRLGRYLRKSGGGTVREREVFLGGWEYAWQDLRILWCLMCIRFSFYPKQSESETKSK